MMPRLFFALLFSSLLRIHAEENIPIAAVERPEPVDFARDLIPFLSENCLGCHSKTTAKGGLNMETPELMLKGGDSGPAIVPNHADKSLALQAAAHLDKDLLMPPPANKARARDLTSEELGLFKLWIDQGAKPSKRMERALQWQPVPEILNAIFAVAASADGQFAACARANKLSIYHLPSGRLVASETTTRDQINALAFNPEGTLLAAAGYREVKLFRLVKNARLRALTGAGETMALSADGRWIATGNGEGTVRILELGTGKEIRSFKAAPGPITVLGFSPDGLKIACGARDGSLTLWNAGDAQELAKTGTTVTSISWSADSKQIASGGADNVIRLWNDRLEPIRELAAHTAPVIGLYPGAPGQLVSASQDGSLRVWDTNTGAVLLQITHGSPLSAAAVRPDGKRFATASAGAVRLWDANGRQVAELKGNRYQQELAGTLERRLQVAVRDVDFYKAAVQNSEKQLQAARERIKKAGEGIELRQKERVEKQKAFEEATQAQTVAGQALAEAEIELKKAGDIFDLAEKIAKEAQAETGKQKEAVPAEPAALEQASAQLATRQQEAAKAMAERERLTAARKEAAGKIAPLQKKALGARDALQAAELAVQVATAELNLAGEEEQKTNTKLAEAKAAGEAAEAARIMAGEQLQAAQKTASEAGQPISSVVFSSDNRTVAAAGADRRIHTWSAENGTPFDVIEEQAETLAFAPGGELVIGGCSTQVWTIDPEWRIERRIGEEGAISPFMDRVCALAFSPDGKLLATGGGEPSREGEIKLWNPATGEAVKEFPNLHSDTVLALEFSPDGKFLASGAADKMARVIDLKSAKVTRTFEGHSHHVLSLSWSLDGRTLVTGSADNLAKVWDLPTGERKKNIEGYDKEVTSVRFIGAGDQILTGSGDPKVRLVGSDGKEIRSFPDVGDFIQGVASTADGRLVVAGGQDGVLRVWKTADGERLGAFPAAKN